MARRIPTSLATVVVSEKELKIGLEGLIMKILLYLWFFLFMRMHARISIYRTKK